MWYITKIKNNKNLLTLKVYGYSNLKIFLILASVSFILGWLILVIVSPITSSMVMYYEKTKSNYARDIEHLISFNKNGLWIKENIENSERIITAERPEKLDLINLTIFQFDNNYKLKTKIFAKKANISSTEWVLENVIISSLKDEVFVKNEVDKHLINSNYDYKKINTLFTNEDTLSFIDLTLNKSKMLEIGYNKEFLKVSIHTMLSMPFLLFLMTGIATVLTLSSLKRYEGFKFFIFGFLISVLIYYFKDFSLALGKAEKIPIVLAIWSPVLALSFFTLMGVLQINEK